MSHHACLWLCLVHIALHCDWVYMVIPSWSPWHGGVLYFVYQSAYDHYRNLQLSFAKNTAAIEKWNMLYDSFILNFNICMWFSLEIIDSHAFCNEIVRLFLSSMGAAILFVCLFSLDIPPFNRSTSSYTKSSSVHKYKSQIVTIVTIFTQ